MVYSPLTPSRDSRTQELERQPIHAITQPGRFWTILEDMAKMSIAPRAENLSAGFSQAVVSSFPDVSFGYRRPKAGPASVRLELCLRTKQRKITADTWECAVLMNIEERTCIGRLSSFLPCYEV